MPINEEKTCNMHTKEKEKSGTCCQVGDDKENAEQRTYEHHVLGGPCTKGAKMNKLYLVLALLFALSACSVGKKCTYTQDGTKLSSYVWFYNGDKPIDLDKNNCN